MDVVKNPQNRLIYNHLNTHQQNLLDLSDNNTLKLCLLVNFIDKNINEIEHRIEFDKFNACQGFKLTKQIQEKLKERKNIMNKLRKMRVSRNAYINQLKKEV